MPDRRPLSGDEDANDDAIASGLFVLRRIPPGRWNHATDGRPHSDNFANSPNGTGTSVDIVEGDNSIEAAAASLPPGFGLVLIPVSAIREAGFGIVRDKIEGNPYHATIQGKKSEGRRRKLSKACMDRWVKKPATSA
jgi:hypothetical protein